jgi:PAS domain S-box-containing protein
VLVVDDEVELMTVLVEMLTAQGFEAIGCSSGHQALDLLRARDFDVLLSDLMMPQMDGIALLRQALDLDPNLVAIIATGQGTVETAVEAMKVGALDYVLKPFRMAALLPVLNRALEIRRLRLENLALRDAVGIYELGQAVAYTLDLQTILEKVADSVMEQCQADEVSIMLPTPDRAELQVAVARGEGRLHMIGTRVSLDQGIAAWVARTHEPLHLEGTVTDPRFHAAPSRTNIHHSVSYPMLSRGKLVAVLNAARTRERRPLWLGEIKALSILASIAAPAIENAMLYGEVREAERRYRGIFENSVMGVYRATPDGRLQTANPALARILQYPSAEALLAAALDPAQDVYPDEAERRAILQAAADAEPVTFEVQARRRDGTLVWISERVSAFRDAKGLVTYEGWIEDISDRRAAEAAREALQESEDRLRHAQKMEAIGHLAGGIAHDFNNLLTAIIGFSSLISEQLPKESPLARWIQEIERAGESASHLTRQLLAFSRKQVLQPEVVDVSLVVAELNHMLGRVIGADVDLALNTSPSPCWVRVDPGQLQQVVLNLAVNARDAMQDGGHLTIETGTVELDSQQIAWQHVGEDEQLKAGRYAVIAVSDTGCGMDAGTQSRIFEPFFTTKEPGRGTGLGLATVYGIVKQSGGDVWVYSEPDVGTTFKIYLPLVEPTTGRGHEVQTQQLMQGGETLLLVDDDDGVRELARIVLEVSGYTVITAANGDEALAVGTARGAECQLLITDLVLPGLSGRSLARQLIAAHPHLKLLFMSGYTDEVVVRHGMLDQQEAYLPKPFAPATLTQRVRAALDA